MHTDRALTYDAWALELVAQQKCGYHIIRSTDKVLEDKAGSTRAFGKTLKTLLKDTIALWQRYHAGGVDDYTREARNITQAIDRHLKPGPGRARSCLANQLHPDNLSGIAVNCQPT